MIRLIKSIDNHQFPYSRHNLAWPTVVCNEQLRYDSSPDCKYGGRPETVRGRHRLSLKDCFYWLELVMTTELKEILVPRGPTHWDTCIEEKAFKPASNYISHVPMSHDPMK